MRYAVCVPARPIARLSLRQQVHDSLFQMLLEGRWPEDARLNDSAIAAELAVSRTPVREALIQLETEGLLSSDPHRGFFVPSLRAEEAREIYPILWSLEQLALFLAAGSALSLRKTLDRLNSQPFAKSDSAAALQHDRAWHAALVEASENARLIRLATRVEAVSRRYASLLPSAAGAFDRRFREHAQIAEALATEQPARAFALLKMHWRAELDEVLAAREAREKITTKEGTREGTKISRAAAAGKL